MSYILKIDFLIEVLIIIINSKVTTKMNKKQISFSFSEQIFLKQLIELTNNDSLSDSSKILKIRFLLVNKLNRTEVETSNIKLSDEEIIFKNKPKILIFDGGLFNSSNSNNETPDRHIVKFENHELWFYCDKNRIYDFYIVNNGLIISDSVSSYIGKYDTEKPTESQLLFLYQFIKLLSKNYPTIETYVIFYRYWQTENEKKDNSYSHIRENRSCIVPLNLLYHDLPFMRKYDKYLKTLHFRKQYKIQIYFDFPKLKELMFSEVLQYVYLGKK